MNEVSKNFKCICVRNGVEVWADSDFVERLSAKLENLSGHALRIGIPKHFLR